MNFKPLLAQKTAQAETVVRKYLPGIDDFPGKLPEAMRYAVLAGGKRIRPLLMQESFRLFGGEGTAVEPFMAAIEMIHTHSLIHDDLPAIDNDNYRRGKKTTHVVYGEALGILSGDALLNYAYETALSAFSLTDRADRVISALQVLARKTGMFGMLGGQSVDVENEKNGIYAMDKETLDYIYLHKTSALLEAPLMVGAILAGAKEEEVSCVEEIGRKTGLAFQITDDVLDVEGSEKLLGKPMFSDAKNKKSTYVTMFGPTGARRIAEQYTNEAISLLDGLPGEKEFLKTLLQYLAARDR